MTTLTTKAKPFPWKATTRLLGVAMVMLAKATWWVAKHTVLLIVSFWIVVGKATWALFLDASDDNKKDSSIYAKDGEPGYDANGEYGRYGPNRHKSSF